MLKALRIALIGLTLASACGENNSNPTQNTDPRVCVIDLLKAHDLLHKTPEERSQKEVFKPVPPEKLRPLFTDFDQHDPFLRDLYVGFIVGALATHQGRLFVEQSGQSASVHAGSVNVALQKTDGLWRISIEQTVPGEIKDKAMTEKQRFEDAQKAGR